MTVGTICNRTVTVTEAQTGVSELASLMRHHHVGSVVVVVASLINREQKIEQTLRVD